MAGRQIIDIHGTTEAEAAEVWRLLGDSSTWPAWTPIESVVLERPGGADGVGEIRTFTTGRYRVREEIVERQPERRLGYELLSGLPVRDYRANIDLTPRRQGTEIHWHTTFTAKIPGSGWLYRWALAKRTQQFVDGLARHAAGDRTAADRGRRPR
jgi:uncharacterized protein YndB with AHSA1/START domain